MAVVHVGEIDNATANANSSVTLTVGTAVPVGSFVVVTIASGSSVPSVSDSSSHTYTEWLGTDDGGEHPRLFYTTVTTQLEINDTIVVSESMMKDWAVVANEFTGVSDPETEDTEASNNSTGTAVTVTAVMTNAANLIVGMCQADPDELTFSSEDADTAGGSGWTSLTRNSQDAVGIVAHAYKVTTSAVSQTYDPSMTGSGGGWVALLTSVEDDGGGPAPSGHVGWMGLTGVGI